MIFEKIQEQIADQLGIDLDDIEMDSNLEDDIGAAAVDVIELLMHVEEEFDITIPEEEVGNFVTVGDIVEYIKQNQ